MLLAAAAAVGLALACGDVPTLENGIAYVTPIELPSPAVAAGDTLRDSTGRAAPMVVRAFGRDSTEITGLTVSYLATSLPLGGVTILPGGYLVADTAIRTVTIVARIGDRLQTTPATLLIVPQPTAFTATPPTRDSVASLPVLDTLRVTVTHVSSSGTSVPVQGIIVGYRITAVSPRTTSVRAVLTNDAGLTLRPDSTVAVDTTDASGVASRTLVVSGSGVDSVEVRATARKLSGDTLPSLRFVLRVAP
jgi:hypothetical protein